MIHNKPNIESVKIKFIEDHVNIHIVNLMKLDIKIWRKIRPQVGNQLIQREISNCRTSFIKSHKIQNSASAKWKKIEKDEEGRKMLLKFQMLKKKKDRTFAEILLIWTQNGELQQMWSFKMNKPWWRRQHHTFIATLVRNKSSASNRSLNPPNWNSHL